MLVHIISIPKSGTYFVNAVIEESCRLTKRSFDYKFSHHPLILVQKKDLPWLRDEIRQLEEVEVDVFSLLGHWRYHKEAYDIFKRYPKFFVYRHPLDVAVSFIEGAIKGLFMDVMTDELKKCNTEEEMYKLFLHGVTPKSKVGASMGERI